MAASVALVVATWALAAVFQSPAQREANASPPPPQPVFAAVSTGTLADQRSYSGTISYSDEAGFTLPLAADAPRSVVTGRAPSVGGTVGNGDVLTEVNTRPVFVVEAPFDSFRDIGFGDEGADVRVLQEALARRGYLDGVDGSFGKLTARAVARWYHDGGYEAPVRQRPATATASDLSNTSGTPRDSRPSSSSGSPGDSGTSGPGDGGTPHSEPNPVLDAFVPFSELLALPSLPATIVTAPVIGAHVGGDGVTDLTLGASPLIVRAEIPVAEAKGITLGDTVTVRSNAGQRDGVVTAVEAQSPDEKGTPRPSLLTVSLGPDSAALTSTRGETVTVQVLSAVIARESLIVPTAAVVGRGEGRGVVVKRQEDGSLAEVPVTVAGSLRGMTAVAPAEADTLAEGDDVRVG